MEEHAKSTRLNESYTSYQHCFSYVEMKLNQKGNGIDMFAMIVNTGVLGCRHKTYFQRHYCQISSQIITIESNARIPHDQGFGPLFDPTATTAKYLVQK